MQGNIHLRINEKNFVNEDFFILMHFSGYATLARYQAPFPQFCNSRAATNLI